ncbi:MAG TPA: VCBS repeat-containing protein, partial [Kofleriaceae bacterium]
MRAAVVAWLCAIPELAWAQFAEPDVEVLYTLQAETPGDSFGWVAEQIGDIDGDRAPDFVIGAPANAAGGANAGRAYVFSGHTGALLHTVTGEPGNRIGFSVAGPGDLDRDGTPDYVVGGLGRVIALSGADHHILFDVRVPGEAFGFSVGAAGDVNRDHRPDVIVGAFAANGATGKVYMLSGKDGSVLWIQTGPNIGAGLGRGVSGIDDVDHDGVPDQVAGAPGAGPTFLGAAFVYSGRDGAPLRTLEPDPTAINFGTFFVHDAGDVDRDGVGDILIGDFGDTEAGAGAGKAYVFSGRTGDRLWVFLGETAGDGFGIGRGVGDVDHDHHADLLLASFISSAGAPSGGKVYLYS